MEERRQEILVTLLKKNPNFIPWKKEGKKSLWPFWRRTLPLYHGRKKARNPCDPFSFMVIKHVMQAFLIQQLQRFKNSLKNLPTLIPSPSWVRSVNSYYFQARKCLNLDSVPFVLGYDIHNSYHLESNSKKCRVFTFYHKCGCCWFTSGIENVL
jgi:hypothetical protein